MSPPAGSRPPQTRADRSVAGCHGLLPYEGSHHDPPPPDGGFVAAVSLILTELPTREMPAGEIPAHRETTAQETPAGKGGGGATDPRFLLIRRARHERDPWSGQMALPGGRRDPADASLLATAIRETEEETRVDLGATGRLLGRLPTVTPRTPHLPALSVIPFVFVLSSPVTATAASPEVAEVVWAPVTLLVGDHARMTHYLPMEGVRLAFPALDVDGRTVWGLTHRILDDFRVRMGWSGVR